jgi:hypothetical protein
VTRNVTSSSSIFFNFIKWSQKLLNLSLLIDEIEFIWNDWQRKICDKLEINVDHFDNDRAILVYVHFRIVEDAVKTILAKRQHDSLNSYMMINDLLEKLAQLYNDLNKEINFKREYFNLTQELKKFSEFYIIFQRLSFYLKYYEKQLITDLKNKINSCLKAVWIDQLVQLESLKEIHVYLIHLNNDQWVMQDIKEKNALNEVKVTKWVIFAEKISKFIFYKKIEATKLMNLSNSCDVILTSAKETNLQNENCFICHKLDHISRECSNWISRINAVNDNEKDEFNHSVSESDFNSKN